MMKRMRAALAGLVTSLVLMGAMALPAQAAPPQPISPATYTALGDSFAAGFGAGAPVNALYQSLEAYPVVLAGGPNLNFLAVGFGGTTQTVAAQVAMGLLPATTQQVTLTVGGNDLGFVQKATACFTVPAACALTAADQVKLTTLTASLTTLIAAIHTAAPNATIYVTGYPLLFQAAQTAGDTGVCIAGTTPAGPSISEAQADAMDAAGVALNKAIRYAIAGRMHSYAKYVDVTAAFAGHGLCGTPSATSAAPNPDTYINPVQLTATGAVDVMTGPLHPNASGQLAYAASIQAKGFKG